MRYSSWTHLEPFIAYTRPIVESTSCWDRRKLVIYYFLINHSLNNKLFTPINMMVHYLVIQFLLYRSIGNFWFNSCDKWRNFFPFESYITLHRCRFFSSYLIKMIYLTYMIFFSFHLKWYIVDTCYNAINIIIFKIHCLCKWSRNSFLYFRQNVSTILSFIVDDEIRSWSFVEDFEFGEKKEKKIGICNWEKGNREIST